MKAHQLKAGLVNGAALTATFSLAHGTRRRATETYKAMHDAAQFAGAKLGDALRAKKANNDFEAVASARAGYHARVEAEMYKYAAGVLGPAAEARAKAYAMVQRAASFTRPDGSFTNPKLVDQLIASASNQLDKADGLERAAVILREKVKQVPEPDAVARRTVDALALRSGVRTDTMSAEVPVDGASGLGRGKVSPLLSSFFPAATLRAAGALGDPAVTATGPDWWGAVQNAYGSGVAAVNSYIDGAEQAAGKDNPAAQAGFATARGALDSLTNFLNQKFNQGYAAGAPRPGDSSSLPTSTLIGVGAALVGGFFLWKVLR